MAYKILFTEDAHKDLATLEEILVKRILKKFVWYQNQENILVYTKFLRNSKAGDIRFRFGDYRAIAVIDSKKKCILVVSIKHRKDIYR